MKVHDIIGEKGNRVATIAPEATVAAATAMLKEEGVGALVVSNDGLSVDGILSERDLVRALTDHGGEIMESPVSRFMTHEVKTCDPNADLTEIMTEMTNRRIRHLPIVESNKLCGIISIGDVVKYRLEELQREADSLRDYIGGRA